MLIFNKIIPRLLRVNRKHESIPDRILLRLIRRQQRQLLCRPNIRNLLLMALSKDEVDLLERATAGLGVEKVTAKS